MREILFRGKRTDNGEWVEGYLTRRPSPIQYGAHYSPWFIDKPPNDPDDSGDFCNVDGATVGQFTGITDKNGTPIFEGDIVKILKYNPKPHFQVWEIKFGYHIATACDPFDCGEAYGFYIFCDQWSDESITEDAVKGFEVIGNIHDNPELMEARK